MIPFKRWVAVVAIPLGLAYTAGCGGTSDDMSAEAEAPENPPNIVLVFADDMGYGDTGSFGHPTIRTPVLDRLAHEGQKWTNFYAAASVCTPSRGSLLTGRLPIRTGLAPDYRGRRVFFPNSIGGLPESEVTIAELLKEKGYATAAIGKWHLGHLPQYLPTNQGFDSYFGIPYSNDMDMPGGPQIPWSVELFFSGHDIDNWDVPLMENEEIVERPADQWTITRRYTERAVRFIEENSNRPFFLYLAHSMPHTPLFASEEFFGESDAGLYGDVIEEIDWSVGRVIAALEEQGIDDNTLVVFTSDNGPWLIMRQYGGSAGLLRDGKGTTWEGGMREPTYFYWPGNVKPAVVHGMGSTLDILPTIASLTGIELPRDRTYDGYDLSATLTETAESPREEMFFYRLDDIYAVRKGPYKAHFITETDFVPDTNRTEHEPPLLFNVNEDPGERHDIAAEHPEVIAEIKRLVESHETTIEPVENQLNRYPPKDAGEDEDAPEENQDADRPWKDD